MSDSNTTSNQNGTSIATSGDLNIDTSGGTGNLDIEGTNPVNIGGDLNVGLAGGGSLTIGAGASLNVAGGITVGPNATINQYGAIDPQSLDNSGVFNVNASNDVTYTQYVVNAGTLNIGTGGTNVAYVLETPTITNDGTTDGIFNIGRNHASLTLDSHIFTGQTINFADANGTLVIGYDTLKNYDVTSTNTNQPNPNYLKELIQGFTATINYRAGDQIVVDTTQAASFAYTAGSTDVSVIENGATVGTLSFLIASQASSAYSSGLSDQIYCFAAGTRLRTERGEVAVEALREGDRVWSVLGERFEPVTWIGYRQVTCGRHKRPAQVRPVVVSAGAFGPGLPARDLWLSPDHAVFVNDVLIPVKLLENGTTIRQVAVDSVTYYHVELPAHDVVLAEGLAAESYLDVGDRSSFANGGGPVALHPDFSSRWDVRWEAEACAPLIVVGPQVEAARAVLAGVGHTVLLPAAMGAAASR